MRNIFYLAADDQPRRDFRIDLSVSDVACVKRSMICFADSVRNRAPAAPVRFVRCSAETNESSAVPAHPTKGARAQSHPASPSSAPATLRPSTSRMPGRHPVRCSELHRSGAEIRHIAGLTRQPFQDEVRQHTALDHFAFNNRRCSRHTNRYRSAFAYFILENAKSLIQRRDNKIDDAVTNHQLLHPRIRSRRQALHNRKHFRQSPWRVLERPVRPRTEACHRDLAPLSDCSHSSRSALRRSRGRKPQAAASLMLQERDQAPRGSPHATVRRYLSAINPLTVPSCSSRAQRGSVHRVWRWF